MRPWGVISYKGALVTIGAALVIASLAVAAVFIQAEGTAVGLKANTEALFRIQTLGDELLAEGQEQREAIAEYLYAGDPRPLRRYRQAVADESQASGEVGPIASTFVEIGDALAAVSAETERWRATVAQPAIAAVQSGASQAIMAAREAAILDEPVTQGAERRYRQRINAAIADLQVQADRLNGSRIAAIGFGLAVALLAAALSAWLVRQYRRTLEDMAPQRSAGRAERLAIITSLRKLVAQETPEATAALIAESLSRLAGVAVAEVFECTEESMVALAVVGLSGFPIQTGQAVPEGRARYLRKRTSDGPWAEHWIRPSEPDADDDRLTALGIRSRAFAPIRANGQLIGLIGIHATDPEYGRHMVEDLPALVEFALLAETILAPDLIVRRVRAARRLEIGAVIASAAFHPVFQPVVDLATGATIGFEALTRFDHGRQPDLVFEAAHACEMGIALETATLKAALEAARYLPPGPWLGLNVSPLLVTQRGTLERMLADRSDRVVLEITEHQTIEAYAPLREAMLRLGSRARLSVDDVGAGVANFYHLAELRPDFIKIDASLVRGLDADSRRRAVVGALMHFAAEEGCQVIAEGIETAAERATVTRLGVTLGQGYLLGRPAPAKTWSITARSRRNPIGPPRAKQLPRRASPRASSRTGGESGRVQPTTITRAQQPRPRGASYRCNPEHEKSLTG